MNHRRKNVSGTQLASRQDTSDRRPPRLVIGFTMPALRNEEKSLEAAVVIQRSDVSNIKVWRGKYDGRLGNPTRERGISSFPDAICPL